MRPTLDFLEDLARGAGEILHASYGQHFEVAHKSTIDLVTDVDHRSEAFILGEIQRRFPHHNLYSEEIGRIPGRRTQPLTDHEQEAEGTWYVDPLDGTVNFAHGVPLFCVSIGYGEGGKVLLGTVYDPLRDELFSAAAGEGARLNGHPIHCSGAVDLDQALLVTGFPYDVRTNPVNNLDLYVHFARISQGVRRLGAAALDLGYIAAGRFDGYWELFLNPYDLAAGTLIAREAGATVSKADGTQDLVMPPCSVLAAGSPALHQQMLVEIQKINAIHE